MNSVGGENPLKFFGWGTIRPLVPRVEGLNQERGIIMKVLLLTALMAITISCGTETVEVAGIDGKDGVNGEDGTNGADGANGEDGADGTNGIDSTMLSELYCSGSLVGTAPYYWWENTEYMWSMTTFKTGDVFVVASTKGTSASIFYSSGEDEAATGYIKTPGTSQWAEVSYDSGTELVTLRFSNADFFIDFDITSDCTLTNF